MTEDAQLAQVVSAALAEHSAAVRRWIDASRDDRPGIWYDVEAAWRKIKSLRADTAASHNAVGLMRQDGKLRSIA